MHKCRGLSNIEVGKIKKWVAEKEREERKNNIAIKGIMELVREEGKEVNI